MHIHLDEKHVKISYTLENNLIKITWNGFVQGDLLREALNEAVTLAQKKNLKYWLLDQRDRRILRPEDSRWIIDEWFPRFISLNRPEKVAILLPENTFGEFTTKKNILELEQRYDKAMMVYAYFGTCEQAMYWFDFENEEKTAKAIY